MDVARDSCNPRRIVQRAAACLLLAFGCRRKPADLLLLPKSCRDGPRQTCGPTLSTNQMRPWKCLGAPDCLHVPIQSGNQYQVLIFSALLERKR